MPSLTKLVARLKMLHVPDFRDKSKVYVVYAKQRSPFASLEYIEPIIAVMANERNCYALQEMYPDAEVSWEARRVQDAGDSAMTEAEILYLTHTTLLPYDMDANGNPIYGVMESPIPEALYCSRETAEREAPDRYLHVVRVGQVNLLGVGEILE